MKAPLLAFEVITGYNADQRVVRTHSRKRAEQLYHQFLLRGKRPAIYLGGMLVKGER